MKALVLGASGATGRLVVRQLIHKQIVTRILIRESAVIPEDIVVHPLVEIVKGNISELKAAELDRLLRDCNVVISCLGHNATLQGMFGKPRYLVLDAIQTICEAVKRAEKQVKLILMSTTAYTNELAGEKHFAGEKVIFSLLKSVLPPHRDNVEAAQYLVAQVGKEDEHVEWIGVRPDTLVNGEDAGSYEVCESPARSPLFNAGQTARIHVGHFIAELATDETLWERWKYKMPVIYLNRREDAQFK